MMAKFEQDKGHELGVRRTKKKKRLQEEAT
jgi:hypothetical protein